MFKSFFSENYYRGIILKHFGSFLNKPLGLVFLTGKDSFGLRCKLFIVQKETAISFIKSECERYDAINQISFHYEHIEFLPKYTMHLLYFVRDYL